jgi:Undecaprenyl-phosphate galactose phosphotransferase WbaP
MSATLPPPNIFFIDSGKAIEICKERPAMRTITTTETAHPFDSTLGSVLQTGTLSAPRTEAWRQRLVNLTLIFADAVLALFIWGVACLVQIWRLPGDLSGLAVASIVPVALVWVGLRATQGLYPGYGMDEAEELRRQTYALLATLAFTATFALGFQIGDALSRLLVGLLFLSLLFFSPLMRQIVKKWMARYGVWGKPVIILNSGEIGTSVEEQLSREWALGYRPVAVLDDWLDDRVDDRLATVKEGGEGMLHEDVLADAVRLSRKHRIDTLFLAMPHVPREYLAKLANLASIHFRNVVIIPDLAGVTNSAVVARDFAGTLGVEIRHNLLSPAVGRAKRALDLVATILGGLSILPLLLLLSGLVWLESRGPVFYRAQRMGRDGKLFYCVKFRTMVPDAEGVLRRMLKENPKARKEYLRYHKLREDPRVTRVGRFLRKTSLDELPQLWNVLRGEMSLVGPRPYLPRESAEIGSAQGEILRVYPGITGPWQVSGRNGTSFGERIQIDAYYVRNWSIWLDLVILARTVRTVLASRGAC